MSFWEEFVVVYPQEERDAAQGVVDFVRDHLGLQAFEEFAHLPAEELAQLLWELPPDHVYHQVTDDLERLRLVSGILARARYLWRGEQEPLDMSPWASFAASFPAEEQSALWSLIDVLQDQHGIWEFEAFAAMSPGELVEVFESLPEYHAYLALEIEPERLAQAETILDRAREAGPPDEGWETVVQFAGLVLAEETDEPVPGLTIRGYDLEAGPEPIPLGEGLTGNQGRFALYYAVPAELVPDLETRRLLLQILAPNGRLLYEGEVEMLSGAAEPLPVHVPVEAPPEIPEIEIVTLNNILNLNLNPSVFSDLESHDIHTLADIRASGGLAELSLSQDVVETLEAHANLSLLSDDLAINHSLLESGFGSAWEIAGKPLTQFQSALGGSLEPQDIARIHNAAGVQEHLLNTVAIDALTSRAGGLPLSIRETNLPSSRCTCQECDSAVSPGAYLADLLRYITTHIMAVPGTADPAKAVDLLKLERWFHQRFADLPAACQAATEQIAQLRICVEILKDYTNGDRRLPQSAWRETLWAAYGALLAQLGTSNEELRQARTAAGTEGEEARERLAARLGLPLQAEGINDVLGWLLTERTSLTESVMKVFGLAGTDYTLSPAQVVDNCHLMKLRMDWLRDQWQAEDWPATADWDEDKPLVDPDLISQDDIRPEVYDRQAGWQDNPALKLWTERRKWLDDQYERVLSASSSSDPIETLLRQYVCKGTPVNVSSLLAGRRSALRRLGSLRLSREALARLRTLHEKQDSASLDEAEWQEACHIVVGVLKARQVARDGGWLFEEEQAQLEPSPRYFWFALEEPAEDEWPLPWRAAQETRAAWQEALRANSRRPFLDPDLVRQADLENPYAGDTAYDLWLAHQRDLEGILADLGSPAGPVSGPALLPNLDDLLKKALGVEAGELEELAQKRRQGEKVGARLAQLCLSPGGLDFLTRMRAVDQPLAEEWQQITGIMVQAVKERDHYARWLKEDRAAKQSLSPDSFTLPEPGTPPASLPSPWRAPRAARRTWERTLKARVGQQAVTRQALHQAVSKAEEAGLPILRDAMIDVSDAPGASRDEKARWLSDRLLIDVQAGACRQTTRVGQAIETLQSLIFGIRSGRLARFYGSFFEGNGVLELEMDHFEEEWRWLGSYATWRAAMFVFLYPENLLLPTLRRHQTPAFRRLVASLRQSRQISLDRTCQLANEYAAHVRDVATLDLQVTCEAEALIPRGSPCGRYSSLVRRLFIFARGDSGAIYWSTYTPALEASAEGHERSFWDVVPNLPLRCDVIGAVPYHPGEVEESYFIYLFFLTHEGGEPHLAFTRYNLTTGAWESEFEEPVDLKLPPGTVDVVVKQTRGEWQPPRIGISLRGVDEPVQEINYNWRWDYRGGFNGYFERSLDLDGKEWEQPPDESEAAPIGINGASAGRSVGEGPGQSAREARWKERQGWTRQMTGWGMRVFASIELSDEWWAVVYAIPYYSNTEHHFGCRLFKTSGKPKPWEVDSDQWLNPRASGWADSFYKGSIVGPSEQVHLYLGKLGFKVSSMKEDRTPFSAGDSLQWRAPTWGESDYWDRMLAYQVREGDRRAIYLTRVYGYRDQIPIFLAPIRLTPSIDTADIVLRPPHLDERHGRSMAVASRNSLSRHLGDLPFNTTYVEELYYQVPLQIARVLQERAQYLEALDWYRCVYDYAQTQGTQRYVYYGLRRIFEAWKKGDGSLAEGYKRQAGWLEDPLDPHAIAGVRPLAHLRHTLCSLVRCLLAYADAAYTQDTPESVAQARGLYLTAMDLLQGPELAQETAPCERLQHSLKLPEDAGPEAEAMFDRLGRELARVGDEASMVGLVADLAPGLTASTLGNALRTVREMRESAPAGMNQGQAMVSEREARWSLYGSMMADSGAVPGLVASILSPNPIGMGFQPRPPLSFCLPPNPVPLSLRLRAELNLHKMRACRNIAGMERPLEPYAAPTDMTSGLPSIGVGGRISLPLPSTSTPTPYRYDYLVERAQQLTDRAAQMEAAYRAAMEGAEREAYNLLNARQDLQLARATVRLQDLRVTEAEDGVALAELQQERAMLQANTYQTWIDAGLNEYEMEMLDAYTLEAEARKATVYAESASRIAQALISAAAASPLAAPAAAASAGAVAMSSVLAAQSNARAIDAGTQARIASFHASHERRKQEWELARLLAGQDILLGEQQVQIAGDRVRVVQQEHAIASLQTGFAAAAVEFLDTKFFRAELYAWMGEVLGDVYSYFLQQATTVAKLAESQLAFERQQAPAGFIQPDYWTAPAKEGAGTAGEETPDRRGLTGSARLLADIYRLDQYRLETEQRKLQLVKTLSLSHLAPAEFQRFRQTGVIRFGTPLELFDRDFPGHHLRLIKRVRTSLLALIPPTDGIHATLSTTGLSQVVTGTQGVFQTVQARRSPESVALSSPMNATGLFELTPQQGQMLLPFESMGVDTTWEFRLPRASNRFDFGTIADVLVTIEYTALDSYDYRQQVINRLGRDVSADRAFSFRHEFADPWYDLHNADQTATPMEVRFETRLNDFPPNVDDLRIQHVLLYFAGAGGDSPEVQLEHLRFSERGGKRAVGGAAMTMDGVISTRRGNASAWMSMIGKSPAGEWVLALPDNPQTRARFEKEEFGDILLVITCTGQIPEWPD